jgi:hypothetical protein
LPLNDGYDPNEGVVILRQHLQEILAALSWAHHYFEAVELSEAYREGKQTPKASKITIAIARAYNHAEGYLNDGIESITEQQSV